jgi:hypothetical protein
MSTEKPPEHSGDDQSVIKVLLLVGTVIAWPALFLALLFHLLMKQQTRNQHLFWISAGILGLGGVAWLFARANPSPFLLQAWSDFPSLISHWSKTTAFHLLRDLLPLWERSVLLFPICLLMMELFRPKNLQASLLAQERQHRTIQVRKSKRATHRARKAPDQINGKGVLGVLIDNPND